MSDFIQYDTSQLTIDGVNIAKAIQSDKRLIFNESYTITGIKLTAPSVYACYDLTVIGDIDVGEIEVRGNLYVIGNIKTKQLSCLKSIFCSGNIDAKTIMGSEIVANDITCSSIFCTGNVIVRTTIDIEKSLQAEKSVMAGEGILGSGKIAAKNAVAVEYFDFDGEVLGKFIELDTNATFGEHQEKHQEEKTFEEVSSLLKNKIAEELQKAGDIDENHLVEVVKQIYEMNNNRMSDWKYLTYNLIELSYVNRINNLRDYLIIFMAKKVLPEEIVGYETIEHVFDNLLSEAEKELDALQFYANNIEDFAYSLNVVNLYGNELPIEQDDALDRIFQSIGIKYKTVKSFLNNNRRK